MIDLKTCSFCKELLPITNFGKNKRSKDGLRACCKSCRKQKRLANIENEKAKDKIYRDKYKVERRERARKYYWDHREERQVYGKKKYQKNKEDISIKNKAGRAPKIQERSKKREKYLKKLMPKVKKLFEQGLSQIQIGKKLSIGKYFVVKVLKKLDLYVVRDANIITEELKSKVKSLFDEGKGSRKIAEELNVTRYFIKQIYKALDIYDIGRKRMPRDITKITHRTCGKCETEKPIDQFGTRLNKKGRISFRHCKDCIKKESRVKGRARYHRLKNNPEFRLKKNVSWNIWHSLTKAGSSKKGETCIKYLSFTITQLKEHLERQFEPWMNWENLGPYEAKKWDDNDLSTWRWQVDHIIPQSDLPYTNMNDLNFKKCWDLSNLRPYSAKFNNMDGVKRIRHKKLKIK